MSYAATEDPMPRDKPRRALTRTVFLQWSFAELDVLILSIWTLGPDLPHSCALMRPLMQKSLAIIPDPSRRLQGFGALLP